MNDEKTKGAAAPPKPQEIPLSAEQGEALNASIDQLNAASALSQERIKAYTEAAQREREAFGRMLSMHQTHVLAIVRAAGMEPKDFQQHGVFREDGKWVLRARPQSPQDALQPPPQ